MIVKPKSMSSQLTLKLLKKMVVGFNMMWKMLNKWKCSMKLFHNLSINKTLL